MRPLRACIAVLLTCFAAIAAASPAIAGRFEAGTFTSHDTITGSRLPERVTFQEPFDEVPVVVAIASSNGSNSATIRITNVTTTGFDELALEPDNWDGRHLEMVIHYIAVEPGRHALPDGTIVEAGRTNTSRVQFGSGFSGASASWETVNFTAPLSGTPTVLHNLQTANSETRNVANQSSRPHITSIIQSPNSSGFQLAIDRSQGNSGPWPSTETIGWIAFPSGDSGTFPDLDDNTITWSTRNTSANIRGWDNGCFSQSFGQTSGNAVVVAKKMSRNNNDGGWLRYCSVDASAIRLRVDEDRDQDSERRVASSDAEQAAIIAFSQPFHANLRPIISATKIRWSIDSPGGGDFAIPGAVVEYVVTVENTGNVPPDAGSVVVLDPIPPELKLIVDDYGGATGIGPIGFEDNTSAPGLTCPYNAVTAVPDCIDFSINGTTFGHLPDGGTDGTDPDITHIRITPSGYMFQPSGSGTSSFEVRFRAEVR